jgi:HEPN domain-containing protein
MISNECKEWLRFAKKDINAADILLKQQEKDIENILYHCQQAAEKALKAFLVNNNTWSGKIHDLDILRVDCGKFNAKFNEKRVTGYCDYLDNFAIAVRYPFHKMVLNPKDAIKGFNSAKRVYDFISEILGLGRFYFPLKRGIECNHGDKNSDLRR